MINIKILLALNNKEIKSRLDKKYGNRVYNHDITCMEDTIEFLSNNKDEFIVITKDNLPGNIDKRLYIKQLRLANSNIKIVYIVDILTQDYKEFLFANEVFNIIEGNNIDFKILINYIDNPKNIVYRNIDKFSLDNNKKRVIGVCGTPGVGKSLVSSIIANNLASLVKDNVILVDMNIKNPSIDILNNLDSNTKNLCNYVNSKDELLGNYIIKRNDLSFIVNKPNKNFSISKIKFDEMYRYLISNYLYSIIDLSSDTLCESTKFWLKKVTDLILVINPNYLSIRQALIYLSELKNNNIFVVLNCVKQGSLEMSQIESLLFDYKIIGKINYGKNVESVINGSKLNLELSFDLCELFNEFKIQSKVNIKDVYFEKYKKFKEKFERV